MTKAPALLANGVQLKDYQLLGVSWLNLLKRKGLSCILADEMGEWELWVKTKRGVIEAFGCL